jgi:hypothetical protein
MKLKWIRMGISSAGFPELPSLLKFPNYCFGYIFEYLPNPAGRPGFYRVRWRPGVLSGPQHGGHRPGGRAKRTGPQ